MKRMLLFIIAFLLLFLISGCETKSKTDNILEGVSKTLRRDYGDGQGVRIAVIDSGASISNESNGYALNFSEEDNVIDFIDHGVPIANIISSDKYGLAPKATVYSLKVINGYGNASTQSVFEALKWCKNNSIDIINMSLSFGSYNENVKCIISELIEQGVIIVASINNNDKEVDYPSMYDGVICVGKTNLPNLYDSERSIIFIEDYSVKAIGSSSEMKDYVGNSFLTPIVTGIIACLIDKTNTEGSVSDVELISAVKFVLNKSNIQTNLFI